MLFTIYKKDYYSTCFTPLKSIVFHCNRSIRAFMIDQLAILNFLFMIYYLYYNVSNTFWNGFIVTLCIICLYLI